ncbi:hypothetical protein [Novosphingobium sp.]|uniref:hypothetical protein n=1 Tax=Novosphingobium sp. TaxID=1874826 RepID=UPI0031D4961B
MKYGLIAALALLAGTAVQAQTAPSDAAPAKPVKEKRICRAEEDTSSIVAKRICHTKAEWSAIDGAQENSVDTAALQRSNQRR